MSSDPAKLTDEEVIALAQAEREAGIPDVQTAEAAAEARKRISAVDEPEARPS